LNNLNILKYEIRRIVFSKTFFYMALIIFLFSYDILTRLIINGSDGTAPFSKLSYSHFAAMMNPMLLSVLIFLSTSIFSEKELSVRKIIFSTPVSETRYHLIKGAATATDFIALSILPILASFVYYYYYFSFTSYSNFLVPIIAFMISPAIFIFGLSMAAGKISVKVLYVMVPVVFLGGLFNTRIPVWFDLCGNNFLLDYRFIMASMDLGKTMPYILPHNFILSRLIFAAFGIILFVLSCRRAEI